VVDGVPVFDVCGELPTGTTVLEASAGTGKTFTIAALATRYVAEGLAELPQMLLVTFGRMATAELRDRVRARLVSAERELRRPGARESDDELIAHLAAVDDEELERRRDRLTRALAQFDAATIATTHGFCQHALAGLGISADMDADAELLPDMADLVDEVVDDLYLSRYATGQVQPVDVRLTVKQARDVAKAAVSDVQARLEPAHADRGSEAGQRFAFAQAVRAEVERRKRDRRLIGYDDLLTRLRDTLADPVSGEHAAQRLRDRYRFVLVDEFQDTDPVQWEVLQRAFHGHVTLVLIGDPKQAIYAFRGADVVAYLHAAEAARSRATLGRNYRTDAPLLRAVDAVFAGAALGDDRIVVRPVDAHHPGCRLSRGASLRLRVVPRKALGERSRTKTAAVGRARELIARDVAADIVQQLSSGIHLETPKGTRALQPGDIAVLTRRNEDATSVREALVAAGVPAVQSALVSVFSTKAAQDWLTLLHALEQPGRSAPVAAAAMTPFLGWDADRLATATGDERDLLAEQVRDWAHVLGFRGVAALTEVVAADGMAERLLATVDGERQLTDIRHVGQALHKASTEERLGVSALADWLRNRIDEAAGDYAEERSRRLESDSAAVQVVTIHASKGLEFPVVYVPFAWDRWDNQTPDILHLHDASGRRVLDVGGKDGPGYDERRGIHLEEERGEDLRLLYVAMTRAAAQLVLWWAPTNNSKTGPLSRVLLGGTGPGEQPAASVKIPDDDTLLERFGAVARSAGGSVEIEQVTEPTPARWEPPGEREAELEVARFSRKLDLSWRRTSYTGLTAAAHDSDVSAGVASEPETTGVDDEADLSPSDIEPATIPAAAADALEPLRVVPSPMSELPGGALFGTLVHTVLERVDTDAIDLDAELVRTCSEVSAMRVSGVDAAALAEGLRPVLATPLGPLAGGAALQDIRSRDRLSEMEFELPLSGGDVVGEARLTTLSDVAGLLRRHLAPDDVLAGYADVLDTPQLRRETLRGYLTGSLDAVLRVRGSGDQVRYLVVDYKTNRLAPASEPVTAWHYRPDALLQAMQAAHYPLQLLLYLVALHRFLRWRQPGYDPDTHLGGGLYLFVRGMCGPQTPVVGGVPTGVFGWKPPASLVVELSRLLDRGQS
jgi:exodeoxyribonuclease V beta subunit